MGKAKSFVDKLQKATRDYTKHCPVCGESFVNVRLVRTEASDKTGSWRFRSRMVPVCKCNADQVIR